MLGIETIPVTDFSQNARILWDEATRGAVIVDPGGDADRILAAVHQRTLSVTQIWLTHSHLDHVGGVSAMLRATGAKLFGHPDEKPLRANVVGICSMFGISARGFENSPEPDTYLRGGETVSLGGHSFKVIFTPGHSTGHLAYYNEAEKVLLGGDVLFKGSIGRTDLPGGDFKTLIKSIRHLVETLPPDTRVLSGHGPDTTLGDELRTNPFLEELRGDG